MLIHILLLLGGCVLLYAGATWLVRGAAEISLALKIPKAIVGLSLVAFGTSAPELIVNLIAAYQGETSLALANVSGSNLTNLLVGFGLCGLLGGLIIPWHIFRFDLWALVLSATIPLGILLWYYDDIHFPLLAVVPLSAGVLAYIWTIRRRFKDHVPQQLEQHHLHPALSSLLFLLGAATLYGGGHLLLEGAVAIATKLRIDTSLVGLTIVAAGTSIPDAVASIVAARRGESEIAVGNLLGSNIANILIVLSGTMIAAWAGPSGDTARLAADWTTVLDYTAVLIASFGFFGIAARWGRIGRLSGSLMIACFCLYMGLRIYWAV